MRPILVCGLLLVLAGSAFVAGQDKKREEKGAAQAEPKSTNDQIEIKTDRFSNVTTVKLKPQVILDKPDHHMTIEIETKFGEKGLYDFEREDLKAKVTLRSLYNAHIEFGDQEFHLLVDGKALNFGESAGGTPDATDEKMRRERGYRLTTFFISIFNRSTMEQLSKAGRIEMRLGSIEITLNRPVVENLREYARQELAQHKIERERKP